MQTAEELEAQRALEGWLRSGRHLPRFMRDFSAQKELFKTIHERVRDHSGTANISWVDAHVYTVDVFLWFLARRGYTLQRTRKKYPFDDIHRTLAEGRQARSAALLKLLG